MWVVIIINNTIWLLIRRPTPSFSCYAVSWNSLQQEALLINLSMQNSTAVGRFFAIPQQVPYFMQSYPRYSLHHSIGCARPFAAVCYVIYCRHLNPFQFHHFHVVLPRFCCPVPSPNNSIQWTGYLNTDQLGRLLRATDSRSKVIITETSLVLLRLPNWLTKWPGALLFVTKWPNTSEDFLTSKEGVE